MTYEDPILIGERVAAGAAWLDENQPGWVDAINLDALDITHADTCVLGQVYGDYDSAPFPHEWSELYGFTAIYDVWEQLNIEWRRLISERRADAAAAGREVDPS